MRVLRLTLVATALGLAVTGDAAAAPTLSLDVGRQDLTLGERTRVVGALSGVADRSRRRVVLDVDEYPFGAWKVGARARTDRRGRFAFVARPPRNVRLRVRLAGGPATSRVRTIYADFPARTRRIDPGGRRPRVRMTIWAFPGAKVRKGRVYAYLQRSRTEPFQLVTDRAWGRRTKRFVRATLPFPAGSLKRSHRFVVCAKEPEPDAFGRPHEYDRRCGEPTLPAKPARVTFGPQPAAAPPPPSSSPSPPATTTTQTSTSTAEPQPSTPAPGPWSLSMTSDRGDYIGGGRSWNHGPSGDRIRVSATRGHLHFSIDTADGGWWYGDFAAAPGGTLAVGHYPGAQRYAFRDGNGLDIGGMGRGCNQLSGHFTVHELVWSGDQLRRARVSFEQHCEHAEPALRGTFDFTAA